MIKLACLIVDNRDIDFQPIYDRHYKHLPKGTPFIRYQSSITSTIEGYNSLLTTAHFWQEFFTYERILVFQHDSGLLRSGIEQFYPYDYVGAPWKFQEHGGNGGLSLRNPKVMAEICSRYPRQNKKENEDVYFSNAMFHHKIGNLAPRSICEQFSVETIYRLGTLGWHAIDKYMSEKQVNDIMTQYDNVL